MIKHNIEFISNGRIVGKGWTFNECPTGMIPYRDVIRCEHCQTPLMFYYHEKYCPLYKELKRGNNGTT